VKRSGRDEPVWAVIHKFKEATLGISLYSYLYPKLAKTISLLLSLMFLLQQNQRRRRQNRFCPEAGGGGGWGGGGWGGTNNVYTCKLI
jgi:hypothetical protein